MPNTIDDLIGKHPENTVFFGEWLDCENIPIPMDNTNKKHRKLSETNGLRDKAIEQIANFVIEHHLDIKKIQRLRKRKDEILAKYELANYQEYLDTQTLFPKTKDTQSGNVTEIILSNYLQQTSGLSLLAFKLTYNPNVEQSIKGDDCLLFNKTNLFDKVIIGESKFRSIPQPADVRKIIDNLQGQKRLPITLPFIAQHFTTENNEKMASSIEDLLFEISKGKIQIINVGFLLSTKSSKRGQDTASQVENHLNTTNPNLVFISLGVDDPNKIIEEAFNKAYLKLIEIL